MRIVFMGTPRFAADILENLIDQHEVCAAFTRPDAVSRRGSRMVPSPVKQVAVEHGIPVYTVEGLRQRPAQDLIRSLEPEAIVVAAYGYILPKEILDIPKYGCLNVHSSILPRWRGAAPVQRAILAQDTQVGVCIMNMEEGLDTGDWCVCRTIDVGDKPYVELLDDLADLGSQALLTALGLVEAGKAEWNAQDEAGVTYADKIAKGELCGRPEDDALGNKLRVQASSPAHPARCVVASRPVTLLEARMVDDEELLHDLRMHLEPGRIIFRAKRLFLGCADGPIEVLSIRPDSKKAMTAQAFAAGVQNVKSGVVSWEGV
ncbi:MAG: methionyl-tRNA formyltransferase [Coriobacteriaceae bacterium]|nr:methionyl-tRNA formyltransferase [Coriobacteriaceae bacterium]